MPRFVGIIFGPVLEQRQGLQLEAREQLSLSEMWALAVCWCGGDACSCVIEHSHNNPFLVSVKRILAMHR